MTGDLSPRLDLLIYAHDGRGLGHVSRSVAIGMASRRLFPEFKILLVTGSPLTMELIGPAPLDWLKLPAYATQVAQGISRGCSGYSNYSDAELGHYRSLTLRSIMTLYRPRCVLVDHMPQGKHRELLSALEESQSIPSTAWVLGVRGVVGDVPGIITEQAAEIFRAYYRHLLWYGDARVLGTKHSAELAAKFGASPLETGYVSRFAEFRQWRPEFIETTQSEVAATISIPWLSEATIRMLPCLFQALCRIGDRLGRFELFIGAGANENEYKDVKQPFMTLPFCRVNPIGPSYFESLIRAKSALIYGGYNSLTDALLAGIPTIVLLRGMQDQEQEEHIRLLIRNADVPLISAPEKKVDADWLYSAFLRQLSSKKRRIETVRLNGAEVSARKLGEIIADSR